MASEKLRAKSYNTVTGTPKRLVSSRVVVRTGLRANLAKAADNSLPGEMLWCEDTEELYIGKGNGVVCKIGGGVNLDCGSFADDDGQDEFVVDGGANWSR